MPNKINLKELNYQTIELMYSSITLTVILTKNKELCGQYLKDLKMYSDDIFHAFDETLGFVTYKEGDCDFVLVLKTLSPDIVAHELTHVLNVFANFTKCELCYESQEWQAIFVGGLMEKVMNKKLYSQYNAKTNKT